VTSAHAGSSRLPGLQHREVAPVAVALSMLLAVVVVDVLSGEETVFLGLLITAPLLVAAFVRPGVTALIGTAAVALAVVLVPASLFGSPNYVIRVSAILAGSLLAVFVAARREQRERALLQMTTVANVAQNAVLWPVPPRVGDLRLAARYVSASSAARIGGDQYEVVDSEHGVRLLIGDVRGKGLDAVRLASAVLGCFREVAHTRADLGGVHEALEATVRRVAQPEDFVTAVLVELTPRGARVLSCGHPPPLLVQPDEVSLVPVQEPGLPLGLGDEPHRASPFDFPRGARLLLHTDGLLEARNDRRRFFPLQDHADVLRGPDLEACLDGLLDRVQGHCGGAVGDDVALLLVEQAG
jgi:sigma-B regulation protein RsbU (phosphoserine phosphatase)